MGKAQALRDSSSSSFMAPKKTLEINPFHPIVLKLRDNFLKDKTDRTTKELTWLLYETSLLTSGFSLDDHNQFASRIHKFIGFGLDIGEEEEEVVEEKKCLILKKLNLLLWKLLTKLSNSTNLHVNVQDEDFNTGLIGYLKRPQKYVRVLLEQ